MPETSNLKLPITEDDREDFIDWRNSLNGPGEDSAMAKIDKAVAERERVYISAEQPEGMTEKDTWLKEVE